MIRLSRAPAGRPILLAALAATVLGCGVAHIDPYQPKRRDYSLPPPSAPETPAPSPGSLWRDGSPAAMLFTDARALRENDLVVVRVEEIADARRAADTEVSRESQHQAAIAEFLGLMARLQEIEPRFTPSASASSGNHFRGQGTTSRTERLTATVPAIVRKVLPNGNLFIEGHRVVLVNSEEQHFYISGVVRPIDIDQENSIKSSMIADAEIEFTGRGVISDANRRGWLSRYLGWAWPF